MLPSNRADLPAFISSLEVLAPVDEKLQQSGYLHGESALNKFLETYEDVWVSVKEKSCMADLRKVILTHKNSLTLELRRQLVAEHILDAPIPRPEAVEEPKPAAEEEEEEEEEELEPVEEKVDDDWDWDDDEEEEEGEEEPEEKLATQNANESTPGTEPSSIDSIEPIEPIAGDPAVERGQLVDIYMECSKLGPESTLLYTNLYRSLLMLLYSRATDRLLLYTDALYLLRHVNSFEIAEFSEYLQELSDVAFEEGKQQLRERIMGPVLEAMAVYITRQVVKKTSISANESDELAQFIRRLNVYPAQLAVVSCYFVLAL